MVSYVLAQAARGGGTRGQPREKCQVCQLSGTCNSSDYERKHEF